MFYAENSTIKTLDVVSIARGHIEDLSLELSPQHQSSMLVEINPQYVSCTARI